MVYMPPCIGPGRRPGALCCRESLALGLCPAHYKQHQRGKPLTPLREAVPRAEVARVHTSIRLSPECAEVVRRLRAEARDVLEAWAADVIREGSIKKLPKPR